MTITRLALAGLLLASTGTLAACDDGYGYGYGGPAVGYGPAPAYYDGYAEGPYAGYPSYYGWYGSYYYPGAGFYVYDQYRRPYRWNGDQRRYWQGQQRNYYRGTPGAGRQGYNRPAGRPTANWGGFNRSPRAAGGGGGGGGGGRGSRR